MALEDHLGDILRKAREARSIPLEQAASWTNLTSLQLERLEHSGAPDGPLELRALAQHLQLHPQKLQSIAAGWSPAPVNLSQWRQLRQYTTTAEGLSVHSYLIWDEVSREAALFDTGWQADPALATINEHQLQLRHIFLTHTHDDHINALPAFRERFPKLNLHTSSKNAPPQHRNRPDDFLHLGQLRVTNRPTPGHAEDGVCYLVGNWPDDAPRVAFIGDTLFAGSMATGHLSHDLLLEGVRHQLLTLPSATLLCPGHGPLTTVAEETAHNPFFGS